MEMWASSRQVGTAPLLFARAQGNDAFPNLQVSQRGLEVSTMCDELWSVSKKTTGPKAGVVGTVWKPSRVKVQMPVTQLCWPATQ